MLAPDGLKIPDEAASVRAISEHLIANPKLHAKTNDLVIVTSPFAQHSRELAGCRRHPMRKY